MKIHGVIHFIFMWIVIFFYCYIQLTVFDFLAIVLMVVSHELGHYMIHILGGHKARFAIVSGNPAVVSDEYSTITYAAGFLTNIVLLPLLCKLISFPLYVLIGIIFLSSSKDISNIIRLRRTPQ